MSVVLALSTILMIIKFVAFFITHSNAIFTDALESIINVVAGAFSLFGVYYSSKPKDEDHPYGHGKVEYISAGFEGGMIFLAGIAIVVKASYAFIFPNLLHAIDNGLYLIAFTGLCNFIAGQYLIRFGKKNHSATMVANGRHLVADMVSTIGIIVGLVLITLTGKVWIDNAVAILFGLYILITGYRLMKSSVNNLLDEADYDELKNIVAILNKARKTQWIDFHNLRVLKHGNLLHVDCHITLPWYMTFEEAHNEVSSTEKIVKESIDRETDFFIHADPCIPASCKICTIADCKVRKETFQNRIEWTLENLLPNQKHGS